jgi:hypothetical protein
MRQPFRHATCGLDCSSTLAKPVALELRPVTSATPPPMHRPENYETLGCLVGCAVSALLWLWPIPVVLIVEVFGLTGQFADYMYIFAPFLAIFPLLGVSIGRKFNKSKK